ncbi:MAG: UDP-N-acetylmuramate dehydrogenase [Oscillospiraceae bacterium]|nr:UDP-N-acetylmuramate dehydrogenase [Oscillospiraceae bacterium]
MGAALAKELRRALPRLRLLENEPMSRHCSFRTGGPAEVFAEPSSPEELAALRALLWSLGEEGVVIGRGTNLLVRDGGVRGAVIHIGEGFGSLVREGETLRAGAGLSLARLAGAARDWGLAGLEFAHGIPGSLGGAVLMNAGAYGGEMKDAVVSVSYLDERGERRETEEPGFAYRRSRFSGGGEIVLGAALRLEPGDPAEISARMRALAEKRAASQPLDLPSAGSTFKRPAAGYAAALIDAAGLKGCRVGGAMVSAKHAGFVVNAGGATSGDILALMAHIQEEVERRFGVSLEPEVKIIGADKT